MIGVTADSSSGFDWESGKIMLVSWVIFIVLVLVFLAICLYHRKRNKAKGKLDVTPHSFKLEHREAKIDCKENSLESCLQGATLDGTN